MAASFEAFKASLAEAAPPHGLGGGLDALWHAAKGDWNKAHELAQTQEDATGAWIHAHLHRVEGDQENAGYWYRRAGKPHPQMPLDAEWEAIARALLSGH